MSPYAHQTPTSGPRPLRRSRNDRYIGGVCGGVAQYLNMDATLVRILTVLVTLFTGVPVVLYLVALFLMPEEDVAPGPSVGPVPTQSNDSVWGAGGPPWAPSAGTRPAAPADPPRREGEGL